LKQLPPGAVLLFEDETILRLFPVLRRAWSLRGEQAIVPITGRNAKRVLFGTINPRTGHRIVLRRPNMRQENFQDFLWLLRRSYPGREIWLLLDEAPCHLAPRSQALAAALNVEMIWLPKQCPELNAMDQLFRGLKGEISANYQFKDIDEHADYAEEWIFSLTRSEALLKASVFSENFWLRSFLQ
jgi:DDE superfamily endonuclease